MTSPERYDPAQYPPFAVTVDLVVLTVRNDRLCVLLIERGGEPFKGDLALPGGFTGIDEDLQTAAYRELAEETGLGKDDVHLEQLGVYGDPERDPRMRVVSVAWLALQRIDRAPTGGSDATSADWYDVDNLPDPLAFDHARILSDALSRARTLIEDVRVAASFLPPTFTAGQLRHVYEAVWGAGVVGPEGLDRGNFQRQLRDNLVRTEALEMVDNESVFDPRTGRPSRRAFRLGPDAADLPVSQARIEPPRVRTPTRS